eukprot:TRINITY_DN8237_c0_g1_i2.p1 TRINITY_DN8237_c0_g1~~TRINITY_DN8237_c0_g1_i2.p1  ORF type:complete len:353 (+),score=18.44 TRINITY_DN8237_c0_g1_i2:221-1279(+)
MRYSLTFIYPLDHPYQVEDLPGWGRMKYRKFESLTDQVLQRIYFITSREERAAILKMIKSLGLPFEAYDEPDEVKLVLPTPQERNPDFLRKLNKAVISEPLFEVRSTRKEDLVDQPVSRENPKKREKMEVPSTQTPSSDDKIAVKPNQSPPSPLTFKTTDIGGAGNVLLIQVQGLVSGSPSILSHMVVRGDKVFLGRNSDCQIVLKSMSVSGRHLSLEFTHEKELFITDISTNGTFCEVHESNINMDLNGEFVFSWVNNDGNRDYKIGEIRKASPVAAELFLDFPIELRKGKKVELLPTETVATYEEGKVRFQMSAKEKIYKRVIPKQSIPIAKGQELILNTNYLVKIKPVD